MSSTIKYYPWVGSFVMHHYHTTLTTNSTSTSQKKSLFIFVLCQKLRPLVS